MIDITTISTDILERDLHESEIDISTCKLALDTGITKYSCGLVEQRLKDNKNFVSIIMRELNRRIEKAKAVQN